MAIEDEIINISDIDIGTEILNSDKLLIETSNGTKMIAFKDFVVGPDNISSVRQSQIEGNVEGEADTFYNVVTGFNILNNQTTPGLNTQYDQISGTVELGKFNFNAIANLASVSADIATNAAAVDELRVVLDGLASLLADTSSATLNSITLTTSACNCIVRGAFKASNNNSSLSFTTAELDPSTTNPNCTVQLSPFKLTFPDANEGFVDGSRYMILGNISGISSRGSTGAGGSRKFFREASMVIYRDEAEGGTSHVYGKSHYVPRVSQSHGDEPFAFDIMAVVKIGVGDSLRITLPKGTPQRGSLDIFKIS